MKKVARWGGRLTGSILVSVALSLFIAFLFISQLSAHVSDVDSIVANSFERFVEEDGDLILASLQEGLSEEEMDAFLAACDEGILSLETCDLSLDNPELVGQLDQVTVELTEELENGFQPLHNAAAYTVLVYVLALLMFGSGSAMLYLGYKKDWVRTARKLSRKIGFTFLFPTLLLWYVLSLTKEQVGALFSGALQGLPEMVESLVGILVLEMFHPPLEPLYFPFLFVTIGFFVAWVVLILLFKKQSRE